MKFAFFRGFLSRVTTNNIFCAYLIFSLIGVFSHVLWRDEMQGWLVAVGSENIRELWANNAPSGHPIVYPMLTYISSKIYENPISMQIMQWMLAAISLFIFLRWAPFTKLHKLLFAFGYFPFWEYCLISRHYVVIQLLTFLGVFLLSQKKYSVFWLSLLVALLLNTHALAWSIAIGFCVTMIIDLAHTRSNQNKSNYLKRRIECVLSAALISFSALLSLNSLIQTSRSIDSTSVELSLKTVLVALGRYLGGSILIVPNSGRWIDLAIASFVSLLFILFTILYVSNSRKASAFYLASTTSLLCFNSAIYSGAGSRHFGIYFIIFMASIWIRRSDSLSYSSNALTNFQINSLFARKVKANFSSFLVIILLIHFAAGIHRVSLDIVYPYSASKEVAEFIRNSEYSNWPLFGTRDVEVASVSGYLGTSIYYPELGKRGTYAEWRNRNSSLRREDSIIHIENYMEKHKNVDSMLAILSNNSKLKDDFDSGDLKLPNGIRISFVKHFLRSYNRPERYYLYEVRRDENSLNE